LFIGTGPCTGIGSCAGAAAVVVVVVATGLGFGENILFPLFHPSFPLLNISVKNLNPPDCFLFFRVLFAFINLYYYKKNNMENKIWKTKYGKQNMENKIWKTKYGKK
jgi:hypothetical protein